MDNKDEVKIDDEYIIGSAAECFGEKIYKPIEEVKAVVSDILSEEMEDKKAEAKLVKEAIKETMIKPAIDMIQEHYGNGLKTKDVTNISKATVEKAEKIIDKAYTNYEIDNKRIESAHTERVHKFLVGIENISANGARNKINKH